MTGETTPKKKEPTAQEAMFFFAIVKHTRNKADIDWNAVAAEQGFKNAEVAKVRFGQVKRKLGISSDSPSVSTPAIGSRTPSKKASGSGTPTKIVKTPKRVGTRGTGRGKTPKKEESDVEDDDQTVVGVKEEQDDQEDHGDHKFQEMEDDAQLHAEAEAFLSDPF